MQIYVIKRIDSPTLFFNFLDGQVRENLLTPLERPKISKTAKFESDLLKTNEDIVPQSREILQMFIWWRAQIAPPPPTIQTTVNSRNFAELYFRSLKTCDFQTWQIY